MQTARFLLSDSDAGANPVSVAEVPVSLVDSRVLRGFSVPLVPSWFGDEPPSDAFVDWCGGAGRKRDLCFLVLRRDAVRTGSSIGVADHKFPILSGCETRRNANGSSIGVVALADHKFFIPSGFETRRNPIGSSIGVVALADREHLFWVWDETQSDCFVDLAGRQRDHSLWF